MELRIGICDDESQVSEALKETIEEVLSETGTRASFLMFSRGMEVLSYIHEFDVLFLDLNLPELDGIETGKLLLKHRADCPIIVASGMAERFKEAFLIRALRFITKPFEKKEIREALSALFSARTELPAVEAYKNRESFLLRQKDIMYISSYGSYVELFHEGHIFRKDISLDKCSELLDERLFFRISRHFIVNFFHITYSGNSKVHIGGQVFSVSRRRRKDFEHAYIEFDTEWRFSLC